MRQKDKLGGLAAEAEVATKPDLLGRQVLAVKIAENLTILRNIEHNNNFTLSINGSFGSGKSFLLNLLQHELNACGIKSIIINAWQQDYFNEPLLAILYSLYNILPGHEKLKSKLWQLSLNFIKDNLAHYLHIKSIQHYPEELMHQIKEYLRILLPNEAGNMQVLLIDELDRTKPLYTIAFLEAMLHIFDMPNLVFVLAIDKQQLRSAVTTVFGTQLNFDNYYRKFIKYDITLPYPDNLGAFLQELDPYGAIDNVLAQEIYYHYTLTPREIEHALKLILAYMQRNKIQVLTSIHSLLLLMVSGLLVKSEQLCFQIAAVSDIQQAVNLLEAPEAWQVERFFVYKDNIMQLSPNKINLIEVELKPLWLYFYNKQLDIASMKINMFKQVLLDISSLTSCFKN